MAYLFLIAILLTPIAIIVSLIYSYKKLSLLKFLLLLSLVIALVIGTPLIAFKIYERNFMLSVVPDALNVTSISYSEEGEHLKVAKIDQSPQNKGLSHTSKA
jgi:hypothetical protein